MPKLNGWDMFELGVRDIQEHYSRHHFSAAEYVAYCIEYIRVFNPHLQAVIEINSEAGAIASRLDDERASGKVRSPLHSIPAPVKDITTRDSTAGACAGADARGRD